MNIQSSHVGGPAAASRRAVLAMTGAVAGMSAQGLAAQTAGQRQPLQAALLGTCDCHVHIFELDTHPFARNRSYTPGTASVAQLRDFMAATGTERVVLVQPSVYADDNACLVSALGQLGPGVARGIAVINPAAVTDADLRALHDAGVRGVRVNLEVRSEERRDAAAKAVRTAADKVAPLGWSVQVYADVEVIGGIADVLAALPVPVILDHFAGVKAERGSEQSGLTEVLQLMKAGRVYSKMSALYRASRAAPDYRDLKPIAQALAAANPDRIIWASDWPHTGSSSNRSADQLGTVEPFRQVDDVHDCDLLKSWLPEEVHQRLFAGNAARLYQF